MKQISTREKAFISIGVLAAVAILVYFFVLPALQGDKSDSGLSMDQMEAKLAAIERLQELGPTLINLEKQLRQESGYGDITFKRGIADSMIINVIAQLAGKSEIGELEQLDAKPYTSRKSSKSTISQRSLLQATVDSMYMGHLAMEMENLKSEEGGVGGPEQEDSKPEPEAKEEDNFDPDKIPPEAHEFLKEKGITIEEITSNKELRDKMIKEFMQRQSERGEEQKPESETSETQDNTDDTDDTKKEEDSKSIEQAEVADAPSEKPVFPPIPKTIPAEAQEEMTKWITQRGGKTLQLTALNIILDEAGIEDDDEREKIKKHMKIYGERVKQIKDEIVASLARLQPTSNNQASNKTGIFSVKVIFKSRMDQLVKFLYNLQENAKWLKVESMSLSVSDRKETILSVDMKMVATVLYD